MPYNLMMLEFVATATWVGFVTGPMNLKSVISPWFPTSSRKASMLGEELAVMPSALEVTPCTRDLDCPVYFSEVIKMLCEARTTLRVSNVIYHDLHFLAVQQSSCKAMMHTVLPCLVSRSFTNPD